MLSSGAELSHCEQRGNQSLFTNQLSSVPAWREDTKLVWRADVSTHTHTLLNETLVQTLRLPRHSSFLSNHQPLLTQSNALVNNHAVFVTVCVCV